MRHPRPPPLAALGLTAAVLVSAKAHASDTPRVVELRYARDDAARSCMGHEEIETKVSARLGYVPFRDRAPLVVSVRISRGRTGFKATLASDDQATGQKGVREITSEASECGELSESVALAIAVAIDPLTLTHPPAPIVIREVVTLPPAPEQPSQPVPAPPPPVVPPPPPPPAASSPPVPVVLEPGVGAAAAIGTAPNPTLSVVAGVAVRRAILSIGLEGRADVPSGTTRSAGQRVVSNLVLGSIVPCLRPGIVLACANVALGALNGTGEGVALSSPKTTFYAAVGPRLGVAWPVAHFLEIGAYAELMAALTRTDLRLDGRIVWTTPPIGGGLGARATGRF